MKIDIKYYVAFTFSILLPFCVHAWGESFNDAKTLSLKCSSATTFTSITAATLATPYDRGNNPWLWTWLPQALATISGGAVYEYNSGTSSPATSLVYATITAVITSPVTDYCLVTEPDKNKQNKRKTNALSQAIWSLGILSGIYFCATLIRGDA